ncbi:MAG: hypothetical protein M5U28_49490 [Sandaracinaceae bacterium]|nr:hypothetical protein [Sandaracinaceae bacterium]
MGRSPRGGRAAQEEQGALLLVQHLGEGLLLRDLRLAPQAPLAAAEGLEDPEAEVVDEAHQREAEALEQVVEAEEVEDRDRAHHVHDHAPGGGLAHRPRPALVDAHVTEEAPVEPAQEAARLERRDVGLLQRGERRLLDGRRATPRLGTGSWRAGSASMGTSVMAAGQCS